MGSSSGRSRRTSTTGSPWRPPESGPRRRWSRSSGDSPSAPFRRWRPRPISWNDLAPHIESPVAAAYVAQERVIRGEDLRSDPRAHPEVLELPLVLEEWEPTYPPATYRSNVVEVAEPWTPKAPLRSVEPEEAEELDEPELNAALVDLVQPWTAESNGAARAAVVEGSALGAISATRVRHTCASASCEVMRRSSAWRGLRPAAALTADDAARP